MRRPATTGCCTARPRWRAGSRRVPVFAAFRDETHRLVELAADDMASRRFGRLTTALALVGLNADRAVFGPCPTAQAQVPQRVHRLLAPPDRFTASRRLRLTAAPRWCRSCRCCWRSYRGRGHWDEVPERAGGTWDWLRAP